MRLALMLTASLLVAPLSAEAGVCKAWSDSLALGQLDTSLIDEASGIEASIRFPGRLYHHNDSGDTLRFFQTDMTGGAMKIVNVEGPMPRDIEEMAVGPCGSDSCVFLGDIGDNPGKRTEVAFTLVTEKAQFGITEPVRKVVRARYPDGSHNAEAFAIHPNGDLYLIVKPVDAVMMTPGASGIYRLKAAELMADGDQVRTFEKIGSLDLPHLMPELPFFGHIVTGLDITQDGSRAVLLTYAAAVELGFDLSKAVPDKLVAGDNVSIFKAPPLSQQEAIAWLPDDQGFVYDSEVERAGKGAPAPIRQVNCLSR